VSIAFVRGDTVRPIGTDVRAEQLDRRRIHVRRMHDLRLTSFRDEDGERAHAGEGIRDGFALEDEIGDSVALRSEPGAEVRLGQVDAIVKSVFRVHGHRPPLARDDLDRSDPVFALHPAVLHNDPDLSIPTEDCGSDRLSRGLQIFGYFQDGDVSDYVERARKGSAQRLRHRDEVFVAPDRNESLAEFPLFRREPDFQTLRCRKEQTVPFLDDAEMLVQDAKVREAASDLFPALPRHNDAPHAHDLAIPRLAVKDFQIHRQIRRAWSTSTPPSGRLRRKGE
jgi:hypothetical protein